MDWPKCEECEGEGCREHYWDGDKKEWIPDGVCPACNGTGECDLTADEAAEILCEQDKTDGEIWKLEPDYMHDSDDYVVKRTETYWTGETIAGRPQKDFNWITIGLGETPTAALNAAARAVYERKK
jgi:hypothetical protein